jgi:hypothetical protein
LQYNYIGQAIFLNISQYIYIGRAIFRIIRNIS